jgi:hypothetical protein
MPNQVALGLLDRRPENLVKIGDFEEITIRKLQPAVLPGFLERVQLLDDCVDVLGTRH